MKDLMTGAFLLLLVSAQSCTEKPQVETENVAANARKVLDTPFHFLLAIPGYELSHLNHGADMFSTWGELTLKRKNGEQPNRAAVHKKLLAAAKNAGWTVAKDLLDVDSPDLKHYGISHAREDLAISKTASLRGQSPPTRYSCRIWISNNGGLILAAYRVDGE